MGGGVEGQGQREKAGTAQILLGAYQGTPPGSCGGAQRCFTGIRVQHRGPAGFRVWPQDTPGSSSGSSGGQRAQVQNQLYGSLLRL